MSRFLIGKEIIKLQSVDSTNNYAAKLLNEGVLSDGAVIMAHEQHGGRGQMGTSWDAAAGQNLTFSVVLKSLKIDLQHQFDVSMLVAVSLVECLDKYGLSPDIKWPNDILIDNKKLAGVLIETSLRGTMIKNLVVGIGLNVNQEMKEDDRISLSMALGHKLELDDVLDSFLNVLEKNVLKYVNAGYETLKAYYIARLYGVNGASVIEQASGEQINGRILDIIRNGNLIFTSNQGEQKNYDLKEIKFIL